MDNRREYHYQDDDFLFYIKNYSKYYDAYSDATKLGQQIRSVHDLFYMDRGNVGRHFVIRHRGSAIATALNGYFIANDDYVYHDVLYGSSLDIVDWFASALQFAAMFGDAYFYIEWGSKKIGSAEYTLPLSFNYLPPETIKCRVRRGRVNRYTQRYSLYTKLKQQLEKYGTPTNTLRFEPWQIFHFKYPLDKEAPVKTSMKLLPALQEIWSYMVRSSEAGAYKRPRSLAVERTRKRSFKEEVRKNNLLKTQAQKIFHLPLGIEGVALTQYYDYFAVARYKADQYVARKYFVDAFNEQVLKPFAEKNGIKNQPRLEMVGLSTDKQIYATFHKWEDGDIGDDDFISTVAKSI